jgi:hypothetical protein
MQIVGWKTIILKRRIANQAARSIAGTDQIDG